MTPRTLKAPSRLRYWLPIGVLVSITAAGLQYPPMGAVGAPKWEPPKVQAERSVDGANYTPPPLDVEDEVAASTRPARPPRWPAAAKATVSVPVAAAARAGDAPVWLQRSSGDRAARPAVDVEVVSRAETDRARIRGLLLRLTPHDATSSPAEPVEVTVDYAEFAEAYGGDWVSRLRFVEMPACFEENPALERCRTGRPLQTRFDSQDHKVSADAALTGGETTTFALAAGPSGGSGSYAATPLSPSSSWNVSLQTGDFSWSYPLRVPPSINGPRPALGISYSSQSVDGRTASSNNQTSWLGEGHSLEYGYIERRYKPCADDMQDGNNNVRTGDLCWDSNNATVAFGSRSGELVHDSTSGEWHLKADDGSRFEKLTGASNGDNNGEHWRLTTPDGTQYYFGLGKRYATDTVDTQSTATVPVFGNHSGEPCHETDYATSFCKQAWRWNLDYIVDANANTMTYFYATETNNYGRNINKAVSTYERATHLLRIEYGEREGTEHTTDAPARVVFSTEERCKPTETFDCDPSKLTAANASHWPDVPFDQICTSSTSCADRYSPTFFTRKRLTAITTQVWNGTAYAPVDSWAFDQSFPATGDGTSKSLWLKSISHTGKVGTDATVPNVSFVGIQMDNRVDGLDQAPPLIKYRVSSITSETGGLLSVEYSPQDCSPGDLPASRAHNARLCYPVYWAAEGQADPVVHHFHKYVVNSVTESDRMGGSLDAVSSYQYKGAPAWHYDDDELTKPKYKTYGQFRGFNKVAVVRGDAQSKRTYEEHLFMRGMDGDRLPDGTTRDVLVTDSRGGTLRDLDRYNGFERESIVLNGVGGAEVASTLNTPWLSEPTAVEGADKAQILQIATSKTRTALESGGERVTVVNTDYDKYGMPLKVEDLGGPGVTDDQCTSNTYNRNTTKWILTPLSRTETVSVDCSVTPNRPADVISDVRNYYDGATSLTTAPTKGRLTKTEKLVDWTTGPVYKQKLRSTYDAHGRVLSTFDALDRETKTAYTPAVGGIPTQITTTNPAGHVHTTYHNREWGLATAEVDANQRRTDITYDSLGRLTQVWFQGRSKASGQTPNMKFGYYLSNSAAPYVTTEELRNNGTYTKSYNIYDSLLRPRQTQAPASGTQGGRILTDTRYDSRGLVVDELGPYFNSSAPSGTVFSVTDVQIPAFTQVTYDGAARPTLSVFKVEGVEKWRTATTYGGDRVHVDPRDGEIPTTTITDARGRTVKLRRYKGASPTGDYEAMAYQYDSDGRLATVTDPGASVWTYDYDLSGRLVKTTDPDSGVTENTYDDADQLTTSKDADGRVLWRKYDLLGRQVELRDQSATGALRASWTYDMAGGKGLIASASRFVDGNEYKTAVYGYDAAGRPTGSRTTIPASEGALAGTYASNITYNIDGGLKTLSLPAAPGLSAETLKFFYNKLGEADWFSGLGAYVNGTTYSPYGEALQLSMGQTVGKFAWQTYEYETGTRRLTSAQTDREGYGNPIADVWYGYDQAGNVTSVADKPAGATADTQCFDYDWARRLSSAWTSTSGTCSTPSVAAMGTDPASYWHSYSYDADGNRATEILHGGTGDTTRTYTYDAVKPHALATVETASSTGTTLDQYTYDESGNTKTRKYGDSAAENFTWDAEGRVSSFKDKAGKVTSFVYDADGNRILRKEPDATTLYLDGTEIKLPTGSSTPTSTRYYTHNGQTVATRTAAGVQLLAGDHQGTTTVQINASTLTAVKRRSLPFGGPRGEQPSWTGEKGFVGGTKDATTSLTHLGAREYDPSTGRFISVDPIMDLTDPTQMNGYAYSNHSPVTYSDPSGLMLADGGGGGGSSQPQKTSTSGGTQGSGHTSLAGLGAALNYVSPVQEATREVNAASVKYEDAKSRTIEIVKEVGEILADELGITAGLDCVTSGDLGACGETAINVLTGLAGGIVGKFLAKYGAPWNWKKGAALGKKMVGLIDDGIDAVDDWIDAKRALDKADDAYDAARSAAKYGDDAIDACRTNSFTSETLVLMADGTKKPIDQVKVGDKVMAADPVTGERGPRKVIDLIRHGGLHTMVAVRLADGTTIDATDHHPFWVESQGQWIDAIDLQRGDVVVTADGDRLTVQSVGISDQDLTAYNLTVAGLHTYFAGQDAVLVHNSGCGPNLIYEANPKHGPKAYTSGGKAVSRAPRGDCQAMLECSTLIKPQLRHGVEPETGLQVIFRRHREFDGTEWWHGYVPE